MEVRNERKDLLRRGLDARRASDAERCGLHSREDQDRSDNDEQNREDDDDGLHRALHHMNSRAAAQAFARYWARPTRVPVQPCRIEPCPASKVLRSASVGFSGTHLMVSLVPRPSSVKVKVESISSGQSAWPGWRVTPPASSEKGLTSTIRSGAAISR